MLLGTNGARDHQSHHSDALGAFKATLDDAWEPLVLHPTVLGRSQTLGLVHALDLPEHHGLHVLHSACWATGLPSLK